MKKFLVALSFFTRIPVKIKNVTNEEFFEAMQLMPLVGVLIGAVLWLVAWSGYFIQNPQLSSFLILVVYLLLTGGLHLDGVADTGDAVFSARDKKRMFEIMKDSRLGTYGAVCLFMVLLGYYVSGQWFVTDYTLVLILVPVIGRFCAVFLGTFSQACPEGGGLGKGFVQFAQNWIPVLYGIVILSVTWIFFDKVILVAEVFSVLFTIFLIWYYKKTLGGITGDQIGLTIELTQLFFMMAVIITSKIYYLYLI